MNKTFVGKNERGNTKLEIEQVEQKLNTFISKIIK